MKLKRSARTGAAVALAVILAGCGDRDAAAPAAGGGEAGGAAGPAEATVAEVVGQPAQYQGQTVTVEASVQEIYGPFAFALGGGAPATGGQGGTLIVFGPESGRLMPVDDQWRDATVRVTGRIVEPSAAEVEAQVGWELDGRMQAELGGRQAVLIAQTLTRAGE